jgi:hypothetical protein
MRIQLNAAARLLAANETVYNSIDWLNSYLENSAQISDRYLQAEQVIPILRPLIAEVPYVPIDKPLYHVLGSEKPLKEGITLRPHRVTSYTFASDESTWKDIADAAGISDNDHWGVVQVTSRVKELSNGPWLLNKVRPYILEYYPSARFIRSLVQAIKGYQYQKEVIAYSDSPVKTKLVKVFE